LLHEEGLPVSSPLGEEAEESPREGGKRDLPSWKGLITRNRARERKLSYQEGRGEERSYLLEQAEKKIIILVHKERNEVLFHLMLGERRKKPRGATG